MGNKTRRSRSATAAPETPLRRRREQAIGRCCRQLTRIPARVQFLEVTCRSSGKVRRFAAGTTARYALHAINRKLEPGAPPALHIEAVRDREEPVSFGPSVPLADYARGWRLQTVTAHEVPRFRGAVPPLPGEVTKDLLDRVNQRSTGIYLAKILLAIVIIFLLGGLFTYLLEKLPEMIQLVSSPVSLQS